MKSCLPSPLVALAALAALAAFGVGPARAEGAASAPITTRIAHEVSHFAHLAASGVERGAKAAAHGVEVGAHAAASGVAYGVRRGAQAVAHDVEVGASATARVARRVEHKVSGSSPGTGK
ncbi:MAG: hypothetical protein KGI90_16575 [Burkholderiales bacterium]|nr:hypothetical protein [Burkholderiales bacterium]